MTSGLTTKSLFLLDVLFFVMRSPLFLWIACTFHKNCESLICPRETSMEIIQVSFHNTTFTLLAVFKAHLPVLSWRNWWQRGQADLRVGQQVIFSAQICCSAHCFIIRTGERCTNVLVTAHIDYIPSLKQRDGECRNPSLLFLDSPLVANWSAKKSKPQQKNPTYKIQEGSKCQEILQELLARQHAAEVTSFSNLLITWIRFQGKE